MGKASRPKPVRLSDKLLHIRASLGLSQSEMISKMGLADLHVREEISLFERGLREPPLPALLEYARVANVYVDALIDDEVDLPQRLPAATKSEGIKRASKSKKSSKKV